MSTPLIQMACTVARGDFTLRADLASDRPVTFLSGPPRCGKTLLLEVLAGLRRPAAGFIKVGGTPLVNVKGRWWLPPHERRMPLVTAGDRLLPHLDVVGNLAFGYRLVPRAVRRLHPDDVIGPLGLEPLLARPAAGLALDEVRRVLWGRALLCSPRLLLLDGLDGDGDFPFDLAGHLEVPLLVACAAPRPVAGEVAYWCIRAGLAGWEVAACAAGDCQKPPPCDSRA